MATVELHTANGGEIESFEMGQISTAQALGLGMAAAENHFDGPSEDGAVIVTAYGPAGEVRQGRVTWPAGGIITWQVAHFGRMV